MLEVVIIMLMENILQNQYNVNNNIISSRAPFGPNLTGLKVPGRH